MNISKKIFFIIFSFLILVIPIYAEDKKDLVDEELPAINPFLGGGSAGGSGGDGIGPDGLSQSNNSVSLKNMKLNGVVIGESKRFAIFSFPDGRTVRYEEDTILSNDFMILDIFPDRIFIKMNEVEYSLDLKNNLVKAEG
tara:strand:+ start:83 stop:502 length:420 start_codon:yes stop_codon:yes gene_type:complete